MWVNDRRWRHWTWPKRRLTSAAAQIKRKSYESVSHFNSFQGCILCSLSVNCDVSLLLLYMISVTLLLFPFLQRNHKMMKVSWALKFYRFFHHKGKFFFAEVPHRYFSLHLSATFGVHTQSSYSIFDCRPHRMLFLALCFLIVSNLQNQRANQSKILCD